MAKGIIYLMESAVDGLIKIGKTDNFEQRMKQIENNGYYNVTGFHRVFAIEVEDYDEKEVLLQKIFEKSRVKKSELFSLDLNLAIQLLSALDGKIIYPLLNKNKIFEEATEAINTSLVKDGDYYFIKKGKKEYNGHLYLEDGKIILKKGSRISNVTTKKEYYWEKNRNEMIIKDNILQEDYICKSFSMAASIVFGNNYNGWEAWKNKEGLTLNQLKKSNE